MLLQGEPLHIKPCFQVQWQSKFMCVFKSLSLRRDISRLKKIWHSKNIMHRALPATQTRVTKGRREFILKNKSLQDFIFSNITTQPTCVNKRQYYGKISCVTHLMWFLTAFGKFRHLFLERWGFFLLSKRLIFPKQNGKQKNHSASTYNKKLVQSQRSLSVTNKYA